MFIAQAQPLTNQAVAVGVLMMILTGIAWLVKQIFSMLPNLLDRLDKQEEKRHQEQHQGEMELHMAVGEMRFCGSVMHEAAGCHMQWLENEIVGDFIQRSIRDLLHDFL